MKRIVFLAIILVLAGQMAFASDGGLSIEGMFKFDWNKTWVLFPESPFPSFYSSQI
jgi:hypothetical protein